MQMTAKDTMQGSVAALLVVIGLAIATFGRADENAEAPPAEDQKTASHETVTERGRVVWLADALARKHGVTVVPEAEDRILALETTDGRLLPLVEDVRGRAFRRDERLRKMEVELLARRFDDAPLLQIIRVYEIKDGKTFELDYWCDICAIAMYELKPCDCCQGPIELRRREVKSSHGLNTD